MNVEIYDLGGPQYPTATAELQENEKDFQSVNPEYEKEIQDNIQGRTLQVHFLRISSERKMNLITKMFLETRNLHSLGVVLNIFFSVNTKLIFYSKITMDSNSMYEQFIVDHDRMLDTVILEETLLDDMKWFKSLNDSEQINVIMGLMRLAGGNIIKKMYWRLIKIFNERAFGSEVDVEKYTSRTSMNFPEDMDGRLISFKEYQPKYDDDDDADYNTDCPTHKKVVESRKQWQAVMAKIRKEIETDIQKFNEPVLQKMREKQKIKSSDNLKVPSGKKGKKKESTPKKTSPRIQNEEIDWVQLLPVWNVKQIFSYLDEKTLQSLKNVNSYWAVTSKEVLSERKAREHLDSTIKKSEEFLDHLLNMPILTTALEIEKTTLPTETIGHKKRMEKLRRTGATLKKLAQKPETIVHNKSVLSECFNLFETEHAPFLAQLKPFPVEIPIKEDAEIEKSINLSIGDSSLNYAKLAATASETKTPKGSVDDNVSETTSIVSLVPSIIVTEDDKETW